jgi:hypothetical protein
MICSIIIGSCSYIEKGNINFRVVANLLWTERLNNSTNSSKSEHLPLTSSQGIQNRRHLLMKMQVLAWDRHTNVACFFKIIDLYLYCRFISIRFTRASFLTCPIPGPGFSSTNVVFFCSVQWIGVKHGDIVYKNFLISPRFDESMYSYKYLFFASIHFLL